MPITSVIRYWDEVQQILHENNLLIWNSIDEMINILNNIWFEKMFELYEYYMNKNDWLKTLIIFDMMLKIAGEDHNNKKSKLEKLIWEKIRLYNKINEWKSKNISQSDKGKKMEHLWWLIVVRLTTLNN